MMRVTRALFLHFAFTYVVLVEAQDCPHGWLDRSGSATCYSFWFKQKKSWSDARLECQQYDGELLKIETDDEKVWVLSQVHHIENMTLGNVEWWTGLNNREQGDITRWFWADGEALEPSVLQWAQGEPNNYLGQEHCVEIWQGNFNDTNCDHQLYYICERPKSLCSDGWMQREGHCYFFFNQKTMTWKDSVAFCTLRGAMLIQMNSGNNMQFLSTELPEKFHNVDSMWLGISGKDGTWSWLSGDTANISNPMWAENAGQTDIDGLTKCAYILRDDRNLKWQTSADCLTERGIICTAPSNVLVHPPPPVFPEPKCLDNWLASIPNCFKVNTEPVTWFEARMKCQQDGGDLAIIADEQDQKLLLSNIQQEVWIGLNDREQENKFVWLDQNDQVSLTYWRHGDPDNQIIGNMYSENCVAMGSSIGTKNHGKWKDYPCAFKLGFVCQRMAVRNIAVGKTAKQSSSLLAHVASFAVDNNISYNLADGSMCSRTSRELNPWWEVDLGTQYNIGSVIIRHRMDNISQHSQQDLRILLKNDTSESGVMVVQDQHSLPHAIITAEVSPPISSRYIRIDIPDMKEYLTLCEVEVFEAIPGQQLQRTTAATEMTSSNSKGCGGSWIPETGQCYWKGNDKLTWTDAREACRSLKANLVPVRSLQEGLFLAGIAQTEENLWIGVSAIPADHPVWLTVDRKTVSFSDWGTGEPVNNDPESNNSSWRTRHSKRYQKRAYCALESLTRRTWQAVSCQRRESYICLKRDETQLSCSDGWIADLAIKTCYKFEKTLRNWHEAESACKTWNSHLVSLNSEMEYNFVIDTARKDQGLDDDIWIGLHESFVKDNWTWSDGTSFLFKKWAPDEPNDFKGNEDCGGIQWDMLMNDYNCTKYTTSVCEKPAFLSDACDHGWELDPNTGICFKFGDEKKTWNEARAACQKLGGDLATVKSPDEQLYIYNRVHGITGSRGCWIGASDTTTENIWKGVDGSQITYTDWGQDEPNNIYAAENCASIRLGQSPNHGRWNDQNCTLMFPYICHKSVSDLITSSRTKTTTTLTTTTSRKEVKIQEEEEYVDYDDLPSTTMAWDSRCGYMLEASHFEEFCYQINDFQTTWQDACSKCRQDGGDLLSITSENEQLYIAGRLGSRMSQHYWIGANDRGAEGCWKWSNGDPYFYFNWYPGEPNNGNTLEDCGEIMVHTSCKWNDVLCNHSFGYICKKKASQIISTPIPTKKPPNKSETGSLGCYKDWLEYGSSCYLFVQERSDWDTALKSCRQKGGDLASVANQEQQNFVFSQMPVAPFRGFWIGMSMNDTQSAELFQWSDNSKVTFTTWSENEPNNYPNEERVCVTLGQQTGLWTDEHCSIRMPGYICRMERISLNSTSLSPVVGGCHVNSMGYSSNCYLFVSNGTSWNNAQEDCLNKSGNLAIITDRRTQAFLSSQMAFLYTNYWIGLRKTNDTRMYQWLNGGEVTYTSWYKDFTGNEDTSCVSIRALKPYGLWETDNCSKSLPYICQIPLLGSTQSLLLETSVTTTEASCPSGWTPHDKFCYKISISEVTWFQARASCRRQGADLTSIMNDAESMFIENLVGLSKHDEIWVGLNVLDEEKGYKWSDGSELIFTRWGQNQPNDLNGNQKCVEYTQSAMFWNNNNCYKASAYICKKSRGLKAPSTDFVETTEIGLEASSADVIETTETDSCGTDLPWIYYKDYCYYISSNSVETWLSAKRFCVGKGAELASIHSKRENNIIFSEVSLLDSKAWIGLGDVDLSALLGKNYVWSDNTAVSFFNWGEYEPDVWGVKSAFYSFTAICVTMSSGSGTWEVDFCEKKLPFVCKRRYNKVTPLAAGGCPPDFFIFGRKCFLIRSTVGYDFGTARNSCIQYGTGFNLASINSRLEQMVLVLRMRETGGSSAFIGLKDLRLDGQYDWLDNSPVNYTNFRAGQPSLYMMEHCVEMFSDGTWNSLNCASLRGFICQGPRDSNLSEPSPSIPTSHCPAGYTVYSITEQCYRILNSSQSWKESLTLCQADGATLATIEDLYDMYFLEILSNAIVPSEAPIWIGLADFKGTGVFQWVSGTTVTYTKWASGEPRLKENMCAAIHKGFWTQVSCDISQPAICQAVREVLGMSLGAGQIAGIIVGSVTAFVILGVFIYVYVHGRCRHIPLFCQETYVQPTVPGNNDHVYESVEMANIYETIDC